MTRWLFVLGPGRSGTTLLSNLLSRSSRIYIAPETKYFQQVWSQRHLLRLLPRKRRIRRIVDHVIASEYPAEPPTLPARRADLIDALEAAPDLEEGFLAILSTLSDRPVLGEKTPWHTFFVDRIERLDPDARFVAITRDAPAAVASTWNREGFRRVDTLTRCIARWIFMNRKLLEIRSRLPRDRFRLIRFEDLVRDPEPVLREVCELLGVPLESEMLHPTFQDSSLRSDEDTEGFDPGVLHRWREAFSREELRRARAHTWRISRDLGYGAEPARASLGERAAVALELWILGRGLSLMRSGFYPFGAATSATGEPRPSE